MTREGIEQIPKGEWEHTVPTSIFANYYRCEVALYRGELIHIVRSAEQEQRRISSTCTCQRGYVARRVSSARSGYLFTMVGNQYSANYRAKAPQGQLR